MRVALVMECSHFNYASVVLTIDEIIDELLQLFVGLVSTDGRTFFFTVDQLLTELLKNTAVDVVHPVLQELTDHLQLRNGLERRPFPNVNFFL